MRERAAAGHSARWRQRAGGARRAADATKTRTIRPRAIGMIVSFQLGNVIEFPCFRLKHAFEFHSVV